MASGLRGIHCRDAERLGIKLKQTPSPTPKDVTVEAMKARKTRVWKPSTYFPLKEGCWSMHNQDKIVRYGPFHKGYFTGAPLRNLR